MKNFNTNVLLIGIMIILIAFTSSENSYAANAMTADSYSFVIVSDTTAPAAVSDLSITDSTETTITLAWTASGDDTSTGTADAYDLRYSTAAITASNWSSAVQVSGEPDPSAAGSEETMTVSGLSAETTYYFALKVTDEESNESDLSNIASRTTPDETAPAAVSDLSISGKTYDSITLSWTAPGDSGSTGTAASYDIRYSTSTINAYNWLNVTQVSSEPVPSEAGSAETMTISGLSAETKYYFAIKTADEASNKSGLSNIVSDTTDDTPDTTPPYTEGHVPAKDASGISTDTEIVVHVKDAGAGVDVDTIEMIVNGVTVVPDISGTAADYTLTYDPSSDFINGQEVFVTIKASDLAP